MADTILVTGATGYLGSRIIKRLLDSSSYRLAVLIRSQGMQKADERFAEFLRNFPEQKARIELVQGDLDSDLVLDSELQKRIGKIVHCAAVTRFNITEKLADEVNILGGSRLLEFARTCKNLQNFIYISSVYAAGLKEGLISESYVADPCGFANHYERSKWKVEDLLQNQYSDLPWTVMRVATILSEDESGQVYQYNAVHNTLKLLYYGLISIVPGVSTAPVYLVQATPTVKAICDLLDKNILHRYLHICDPERDQLSLGHLLDQTMKCFLSDSAFRKRGIKRPLFVDYAAFDALSSTVGQFGGKVLSEASDSISPFAKQLYIQKSFASNKLATLGVDYKPHPVRQVFSATIQQLVNTKWGRFQHAANCQAMA